MSRRRWLALGLVALGALAVAAFVAARTLDVRGTLGLRSAPQPLDRVCSSAQDIVLPFGTKSAAGRWSALPVSPIDQDEPRATTVGEIVYLVGGLERKRPGARLTSVDTFVAYDTRRGTYAHLDPLPMRVDHTALVSVRGSFYMIGGYHDGRPLDTVYRYTPSTRKWSKLAPIPTPRGALAGAAAGDRIYAVGGVATPITYEGDLRVTSSPTLEVYDLTTNSWSRRRQPLVATHHSGAASADGKLYVLGGRRPGDISLDTAQRYDPATDRWQMLAPLPYGSGGLQAVSHGRRVIAVGGGDSDEGWVTPATWAYDPALDRWHRLADLRVPRHGHGATTVGSTVYTFGGSPCPGFGITATGEMLELDLRR